MCEGGEADDRDAVGPFELEGRGRGLILLPVVLPEVELLLVAADSAGGRGRG